MAFSIATITRLEFFDAELNTIGDEGCSALKNADWPSLTLLHLGIHQLMQAKTALEIRGVSI